MGAVRQKRELRNAQHLAADIKYRKIGLAVFVFEYAQLRDFLGKADSIGIGIAVGGTEQNQISLGDFPGDFALDLDLSAEYPLYNDFHVYSVLSVISLLR